MQKEKSGFGFVYVVLVRLLMLGIVVILINVLALYVINRFFLPGSDSDISAPLFFGFFAVVVFAIYCLWHWTGNDLPEVLTHTTYNPWIPLPWHVSTPQKSQHINMEKVIAAAMPGDVILRRNKYYLVGLAFSQNSYFTHVGICYREPGKEALKVLHSEGKQGVHLSDMEEFCRCDEVAILRFSLNETQDDIDVMRSLRNAELDVFNHLQTLKKNIDEQIMEDGRPFREHYIKVVLDKAVSLMCTRYDTRFNFSDINAVSCIEYVWDSYKPLFPLHRIREKTLSYFHLIKLKVIIPDGFVKNDYFSYQYSSIPNVNSKAALIQQIKKRQHNFWHFFLSIFIWNGILMTIYCLNKDILLSTWQQVKLFLQN